LKSCLAALEPHTERFLQNPLSGYSADMMALGAALGGSGTVSCLPMLDHMDGYSGTRIDEVARSALAQKRDCRRWSTV
jgi:hypothetical protein